MAGTAEDGPPAARGRVAVIIPSYNSERYLGATIDSVRAQTFEDWQLVVYDDGSTDGTIDVVAGAAAADPRITLVRGRNGGVAQARNAGLAASGTASEFVIWLDHDDLWEPDALELLVAALDAHPECVAAHSLAYCIDAAGHTVPDDPLETDMRNRRAYVDGHVVDVQDGAPTTFAALAYFNWVITPGTLLVRRTTIERVGGFDSETTPADDWDMALRIGRVGDIAFVGRTLVRWRRHEQAQSYHAPNYGRAHLHVREKSVMDPTNSPAQQRSARQAFTAMARSTFADAGRALRARELGVAARHAMRAVRAYGLYGRAVLAARR